MYHLEPDAKLKIGCFSEHEASSILKTSRILIKTTKGILFKLLHALHFTLHPDNVIPPPQSQFRPGLSSPCLSSSRQCHHTKYQFSWIIPPQSPLFCSRSTAENKGWWNWILIVFHQSWLLERCARSCCAPPHAECVCVFGVHVCACADTAWAGESQIYFGIEENQHWEYNYSHLCQCRGIWQRMLGPAG